MVSWLAQYHHDIHQLLPPREFPRHRQPGYQCAKSQWERPGGDFGICWGVVGVGSGSGTDIVSYHGMWGDV